MASRVQWFPVRSCLLSLSLSSFPLPVFRSRAKMYPATHQRSSSVLFAFEKLLSKHIAREIWGSWFTYIFFLPFYNSKPHILVKKTCAYFSNFNQMGKSTSELMLNSFMVFFHKKKHKEKTDWSARRKKRTKLHANAGLNMFLLSKGTREELRPQELTAKCTLLAINFFL